MGGGKLLNIRTHFHHDFTQSSHDRLKGINPSIRIQQLLTVMYKNGYRGRSPLTATRGRNKPPSR